jgi:hypothetical protein
MKSGFRAGGHFPRTSPTLYAASVARLYPLVNAENWASSGRAGGGVRGYRLVDEPTNQK